MRCKDNADSFYNAYLILHDSNMRVINQLSEMSDAYRQDPLRNLNPAIVAQMPNIHIATGVDVVCLAFSLELYIKDLHFLCGNHPKGHNIIKLFDDLPASVKDDIYEADVKSLSFYSHDGYRRQLSLISDGFIKWRYAFERLSVGYNSSFALSLIEAIRIVIALKEKNLLRGVEDL